jgi:nicotinamide-nucleotide amidase
MVRGTLAHSRADIALAVTGIAGPDGGTRDIPVGTVCFAWGMRAGSLLTKTRHFAGDREAVRRQAIIFALQGVLDLTIVRDT